MAKWLGAAGSVASEEKASWRERLDGPSIALWLIAIGLLIAGSVMLTGAVGGLFGTSTPSTSTMTGITSGVGLMAINIALTVLIINQLEYYRFRSIEKRELIRQMSTGPQRFSNEAVVKLRSRRWLRRGALKGAVMHAAPLSGVDLSNAKLVGVDFTGANLTSANLTGADMTGSVLLNADLSDAVVEGVTFSQTTLSEAKAAEIRLPTELRGAVLKHIHAVSMDLSKRRMSRLRMSGLADACVFRGSDLEEADFSDCSLVGANFLDSNLVGAKFVGSTLKGALFPTTAGAMSGTTFEGAVLHGVDLSRSHLENAVGFRKGCLKDVSLPKGLRGLDFSQVTAPNLDLSKADLRRANFEGACILGADLPGARLAGASFDKAKLRGANMEGVLLDGTTTFRGADFSGSATRPPTSFANADYTAADFTDVDLSVSTLSGANLAECVLHGTKMPDDGARLCGLRLNGAKVTVNFDGRSLENLRLDGAECTGSTFRSATLVCANLKDAKLTSCDFSSATVRGGELPLDLTRCVWKRSNLSDADLRARRFNGTDLRGAVLRKACLGGTDFGESRLQNADLGGSKVDARTDFSEAVFGGKTSVLPQGLARSILSRSCFVRGVPVPMDMKRAKLHGVRFRNIDLGGCDFSQATLVGAKMRNVGLRGTEFAFATLLDCSFVRVALRDAKLVNVRMAELNLNGCNLAGKDLTGARLEDVSLRGANLRGATLTNAVFIGVDFTGADLENADLLGASIGDVTLDGKTVFNGAKVLKLQVDKASDRVLAAVMSESQTAGFERVSRRRFSRLIRERKTWSDAMDRFVGSVRLALGKAWHGAGYSHEGS